VVEFCTDAVPGLCFLLYYQASIEVLQDTHPERIRLSGDANLA
jgi:hypothetical protein